MDDFERGLEEYVSEQMLLQSRREAAREAAHWARKWVKNHSEEYHAVLEEKIKEQETKIQKLIEYLKMIEKGEFKNGDKMDLMSIRSFACNSLADLGEI